MVRLYQEKEEMLDAYYKTGITSQDQDDTHKKLPIFSRGISTCNVQWQFKHREWDKVYSSGPTQICSSSLFLLGVKLHVRQYLQQHLQPSFLKTINAIEARTDKRHYNLYLSPKCILIWHRHLKSVKFAFNISNSTSLSWEGQFNSKSWFKDLIVTS